MWILRSQFGLLKNQKKQTKSNIRNQKVIVGGTILYKVVTQALLSIYTEEELALEILLFKYLKTQVSAVY